MQLVEKQNNKNYGFYFNFVPLSSESINITNLIDLMTKEWGKDVKLEIFGGQPKEANFLSLSMDKIVKEIKWYPKYKIKQSICKTVKCPNNINSGETAFSFIGENINYFLKII